MTIDKVKNLVVSVVGLISLLLPLAGNTASTHNHHHGHKMEHNTGQGAGKPGTQQDVDRTISVTMHDNMRYSLDGLRVKAGETIRFMITNKGKIPHEFTIGDRKSLLQHRDMMRKMPDMHHEKDNAITLNPGKFGELIWTFGHASDIQVACLIPGHYEAGMKFAVQVQHLK
ncbi:cupredoxin family protein [uncultured Endozoicomonas sp.]|uniref:cupredoxin domain-containing protein n=1 Tax=uncultured Endozoicomonas sp. TaxID=432652 RepID=UPI0026383D75|nr:cupredoxin family protein [uncultured Endozoicomonas sp.]